MEIVLSIVCIRSKLPFTDVSLLNNTRLSAVDISFDPEERLHYTAFKAAGNPEFSRTTWNPS